MPIFWLLPLTFVCKAAYVLWICLHRSVKQLPKIKTSGNEQNYVLMWSATVIQHLQEDWSLLLAHTTQPSSEHSEDKVFKKKNIHILDLLKV